MKKESMIELFNKLIGSIVPIGETNYDNLCLENQDKVIYFVDELIGYLIENAQMTTTYNEYSIERVSTRAQEYLNELKNWLDEYDFELM